MKVREAIGRATWRLAAAGVASPQQDAEALLAHVLGVPRSRLSLVDQLAEDCCRRFDGLVSRRAARQPLQHLTGSAAFRYLEVAVGPGVFVPRPETEELAGWAVHALRAIQAGGHSRPVAVDLCTGSGVVALSLATEVPGTVVHAVEKSESALAWAERNLAGSGVQVHWEDVATAVPSLDGLVDVVVANPPYVPLSAWESVEPEARDHDPPLALWGGGDGLDTIRAVEQAAARLLRPGGLVGCEHADAQGTSAPAVFVASSRWLDVHDHADLGGRPRFVTARRAGSVPAEAAALAWQHGPV